MSAWHNESMDTLCEGILQLQSKEECLAFLDDICTIKELQDLAQRFSVAKMLAGGLSYTEISRTTGASTATISRVSRAFTYGAGGYRAVIDRMKSEDTND